MSEPRILRFYLDDGLRQSVAEGRHNFMGKIITVAERAGYRVELRANTPAERAKSAHRRGYSMFHMDEPFHDRALTIRRVYHYPFWAIERSARRWDWRVARSVFPAADVPRAEAQRFYRFWQERLFADGPAHATRKGFVYVPLQGVLSQRRSFQTMSPLDMLGTVLQHDGDRAVVATLHPNETYSERDQGALERFRKRHPRLTIRTGGMEELVRDCDYVVTQNSSAAFSGYFFGKPAVLFARSDFHHIAANVADLGAAKALACAPGLAPDFAGYINWFWQVMSINAGRPEAEDNIRRTLTDAGWPM